MTRPAGASVCREPAAIEADPKTKVTIDLAAGKVLWNGGSAEFQMKDGAREALMKGEWDALGQLLDGREQVAALAGKMDYFNQ